MFLGRADRARGASLGRGREARGLGGASCAVLPGRLSWSMVGVERGHPVAFARLSVSLEECPSMGGPSPRSDTLLAFSIRRKDVHFKQVPILNCPHTHPPIHCLGHRAPPCMCFGQRCLGRPSAKRSAAFMRQCHMLRARALRRVVVGGALRSRRGARRSLPAVGLSHPVGPLVLAGCLRATQAFADRAPAQRSGSGDGFLCPYGLRQWCAPGGGVASAKQSFGCIVSAVGFRARASGAVFCCPAGMASRKTDEGHTLGNREAPFTHPSVDTPLHLPCPGYVWHK